MRVKHGVKLGSLKPQMVIAILAIEDELSGRAVITSGCEDAPGRRPDSLHMSGYALDFRLPTKNIEDLDYLAGHLAELLGSEYDVVLEGDHFHVEYDPE